MKMILILLKAHCEHSISWHPPTVVCSVQSGHAAGWAHGPSCRLLGSTEHPLSARERPPDLALHRCTVVLLRGAAAAAAVHVDRSARRDHRWAQMAAFGPLSTPRAAPASAAHSGSTCWELPLACFAPKMILIAMILIATSTASCSRRPAWAHSSSDTCSGELPASLATVASRRSETVGMRQHGQRERRRERWRGSPDRQRAGGSLSTMTGHSKQTRSGPLTDPRPHRGGPPAGGKASFFGAVTKSSTVGSEVVLFSRACRVVPTGGGRTHTEGRLLAPRALAPLRKPWRRHRCCRRRRR
jgi:hypothetical protein